MRSVDILGFVGGGLDLGVGLLVLLSSGMAPPASMEDATLARAGGIGLIALGACVLTTTVYGLARPMAATGRVPGLLMIVYGVAMILVAAAMFARWFPMMAGSEVSGAAMVAVGAAMLHRGASMARS